MNVNELKRYLFKHGVEEGSFYTIGGLGGGEINGIEQIDGKWYTYFSERGKKHSYKEWPSEEEAVEFIRISAERMAKGLGYWKA